MDGRIEYQLDMLDGCMLNVREWLKRHTWIQWYVRNEKGHCRPLWEILTRETPNRRSLSQLPDEGEEGERWKGYQAERRRQPVASLMRRSLSNSLERNRKELEEAADALRAEREQERTHRELVMSRTVGEVLSRNVERRTDMPNPPCSPDPPIMPARRYKVTPRMIDRSSLDRDAELNTSDEEEWEEEVIITRERTSHPVEVRRRRHVQREYRAAPTRVVVVDGYSSNSGKSPLFLYLTRGAQPGG
jgi:hypothetical protein